MNEHKHKALATLRKDGSPRLTGIEAQFLEGELWMGMGPTSMKALDLLRDGRMALHSATVYEGDTSLNDVKIGGRAIRVTDPATLAAYLKAAGFGEGGSLDGFALFRVDVTEVARMTLGGDPPDHMVIESWHEGETGTKVVRRT